MSLIELHMNTKHVYEKHVLMPAHAPDDVKEITFFSQEISENLEDFLNSCVDSIAKQPYCSQQPDGRYYFYVQNAHAIGFRVRFCQSQKRVINFGMKTVKIVLGKDENNYFYIVNAFPCNWRPVTNNIINPLNNRCIVKIASKFSFRRSLTFEMWTVFFS